MKALRNLVWHGDEQEMAGNFWAGDAWLSWRLRVWLEAPELR